MQSSSGKRFFSMIVTLVCVVAAAVIFFQFVRPAYVETQVVRGEVISRENFVEEQAASIEAAQKLIEKYRSDTQVQDTVSRVLPSTPDVGGALYQLTAIASQYNVQVLSTTAQTPQLSIAARPASSTAASAVRPLGVATFQVKFNARYEDLKGMIEKLESNVRLMDVTAVSVAQGTAGAAGTLAVDLTVATYYQISN